MKKVYIDPGHSIIDPGAVGYEVERDLNEKVASFMNDFILGNYVCETKVGDISINSVSIIAKEANEWGADLFVSIHFNAGKGDGYEALVYSKNREALGRVFEKHILAIGQNSRGVKLRPDLGVLRLTNMPAVLNEGAFVDNLKDIQDWNDDAELKAMGIAYAKATAEYLNLEEKKPNEPSKSEYTLDQFIREVQAAIGTKVDGTAGSETISKTVTLSASKNRRHAAVKPVQKRLYALGYTVVGEADGIAGPKFEAAVVAFQEDNGCWVDGEITARNKTWRKLLGME